MSQLVTIDDLFELPLFSAPAIHPLDGNKVIYVKTTVSKNENTYLSRLVLYDNSTNQEEEIIPADSSNYYPKWSGDGENLLFISNRSGLPQVYLYQFSTREVSQQTFTENGVDHLLWHVDSRQFFFGTVCSAKATSLDWQAEPSQPPVLPKAYVTENLRYKMNGRGLLTEREDDRWCRQSINGQTAQVLCDYNQGYGLKLPAGISPDGRYLALERRIEPDNPFNFDSGVFLLELANNTWKRVTPETGAFGEPVFSPDNQSLAMIGNPLPYLTSNEFRVFHYDLATKTVENVLEHDDVQVTDFGVSDFKLVNTNSQLQWTSDSQKMVFLVTVEGRVALYSVQRENLAVTRESYELEQIVDFSCDLQANQLVMAVTSPSEPAALVSLDLTTNQRRTLVSFAHTYDFATYQGVEYQADDGGRIPGYLVLPPEKAVKVEKIPLILNIHGGPYTMHTATFHHEVQLMAAQGYGVLLLNPRGSFGYGQAHINGVINRYGKEDYTDLLSGLEQALVAFPQLDASQLFVAGGSYGGYLTNWIIAHDQRFKAAITQRSMVNLVSMIGTSDNGYFFNVSESGADIKNPQKLWEESPLAYVDNIQTPLLILHSEEDYRCPMEQAEQLYVALKYLKKTARFVRFPYSNHELSRSGLPNLRVKRLEEMMNWLAIYRNQ